VPLLLPAPLRYVLLVVDDPAEGLVPRLRAATADAEVVLCPTADDAATALASGRRYSAVVAAQVGDDLAAAARRAAVPILTVGRATVPEHLAAPVPRADRPPNLDSAAGALPRAGRMVAVCGPGGTGTSVVAAALAASMGAPGATLLADFALRADQAFLHGLGEMAGGLFDLVMAARLWPIASADIRRHTIALDHCRLLRGLRRPGHWSALSPSAFDDVLAGLLKSPGLVVADITGELEGEGDCGSIDVEERHHMARQASQLADVVVVVGARGRNGVRRLSLLVDDLLDHGIDPARIQPVVNRVPAADAPPRPRICGLPAPAIPIADVDGDGDGDERTLLPAAAVSELAAAVACLLEHPRATPAFAAPVRVKPGSLGCSRP